MSYLDIALCSLTVLVGSTLQGSIGFGMGLFASPILILVDERFVPAPILLSTWVMTTFLIFRERHAIDVGGLRWAVVGRAVGTLAAATLLMFLPRDRMPLICGIMVLIGVAMSLSGLRFHPSRGVLVGAGAMSAVMGTVASIGGPPIALVYQHGTGARLRATMSSFFWIGTVMSLAFRKGRGLSHAGHTSRCVDRATRIALDVGSGRPRLCTPRRPDAGGGRRSCSDCSAADLIRCFPRVMLWSKSLFVSHLGDLLN